MLKIFSALLSLLLTINGLGQVDRGNDQTKPPAKAFQSTPESGSMFLCQNSDGGWVTLQPGQAQVVLWTSIGPPRTYRVATEPADGSPSGLYVYPDSVKYAVPNVPGATDISGSIIVMKNETTSVRSGCFQYVPEGLQTVAVTASKNRSPKLQPEEGALSFLCQQQGQAWITLAPGNAALVYSSTTPGFHRLAVEPAVGFRTGVFVSVNGESTLIPSVPSAIDVQGTVISVKNGTGAVRSFCYSSLGSERGQSKEHRRVSPRKTEER
jgi:hypothetical protein